MARMEGNLTVRYLISAGMVSNADVEAAVTAYLFAPDPGIVPLGSSHEVDIPFAIAAHSFSAKFLMSGMKGQAAVRAAVRSATLLAHVVHR